MKIFTRLRGCLHTQNRKMEKVMKIQLKGNKIYFYRNFVYFGISYFVVFRVLIFFVAVQFNFGLSSKDFVIF
jgi:hypothetical protein